jgi:hypothetical protein
MGSTSHPFDTSGASAVTVRLSAAPSRGSSPGVRVTFEASDDLVTWIAREEGMDLTGPGSSFVRLDVDPERHGGFLRVRLEPQVLTDELAVSLTYRLLAE